MGGEGGRDQEAKESADVKSSREKISVNLAGACSADVEINDASSSTP